MIFMSLKPELLAPAGGWDCLKAAVANGADAVFFGLPRFNARLRADNFTGEDKHPPHARVWGPGAQLQDLVEPVRPGEEYAGENTRLGAYAARLWRPVFVALWGGR